MGTVDDPRGDVRKYNNERERVKNANIADVDREELLDYGDHLRGEHEPSTAHSQLGSCRRADELGTAVDLPPLVEWDERIFNRFMVRMADADFPEDLLPSSGGWSEGTRRNYKQHLKNFLMYFGKDWAEDLHIGAPSGGTVERADLLSQDELTALWEVAEHPRDECLIALPLVTWQRNAALRSLRVKDVEIPENAQTGFIRLHEDALGQKRARGKRPLTWATGPVERLIAKHPRRNDPDFDDAPLLCVITDSGNAVKGSPLSTNESLNRRLRTLARRAGLEHDRWESSEGRRERTMRAHILRYTGATRAMMSDEYNEGQIKQWAGWAMDSPQLKRYIKLIDEDILAAADEAYGIESELPQRPAFGRCPKCGGAIEEWHRACPNCTVLLTDELWEVHEAADEIKEDVTDSALTENLTPNDQRALREILKFIDDPTGLADRLAGAGED